MTEDELKEIEAEAKAATSGPWLAMPTDGGHRILAPDKTGYKPVYPEAATLIRVCDIPASHTPSEPDALFIAHSRSYVPRLIAELRRLRSYVQHSSHCSSGDSITSPLPCDCGLDGEQAGSECGYGDCGPDCSCGGSSGDEEVHT